MNTEDTKPTATRVGTLEIAIELKGLPAVLAGLEQIKVAALEAAAAVALIGGSVSPSANRASADAVAEFAEQWAKEVRAGKDSMGMPARTVAEFISGLPKLAAAR